MTPAPTLPRRLYRAVLRLLRPLEAATRRLVVIVARDLPAPALPPARAQVPRPVLPKGARRVTLQLGLAGHAAPPPRPARRGWSLPLADPLKRFRRRRATVPPHAAPRILFPGIVAPHRLPPPPSPTDPIDATRIALRLAGIGRVLADLPAAAERLARWKARRKPIGRTSPLRPGRAPGSRKRPTHEVHEVLADLHYFAREALALPDTS